MEKNFFVHDSSIVDEGAVIGKGTSVWHFSHIMPGAIIGKNCNLGQNVFVDNDVVIGNNVKIQNNVSVYNGVILEEEVFIGPSVVFTNVINPRSEVNRKKEFKKTIVKKGATIGANATIICGYTIGEYAFIGAGSVITSDVSSYALIIGNPGKQIGWMSAQGHKISFNTEGKGTCEGSDEEYQLKNNKVSRIK